VKGCVQLKYQLIGKMKIDVEMNVEADSKEEALKLGENAGKQEWTELDRSLIEDLEVYHEYED
jgi:hypothetical protein